MKIKTLLLFVTALLLGACASSVKLTAEGEKVRVLDPSEVSSCKKLSKMNSQITWVVLGIARPEKAVSKDLRNITRNRAKELGGDTIVPLTVIDKGKQTFEIYKCVNPDG